MIKLKSHFCVLALLMALVFTSITKAELPTTNSRGLDLKNFDTSTPACDDFFEYANGTWMKNNPVPSAYSSWSLFNELVERNNLTLKKLAEEAAQNPSQKSDQKILGDYYATATNIEQRNAVGLKPLEPWFLKIDTLQTQSDLAHLIQDFQAQGFELVFDFFSDSDLKNSQKTIAYVFQGGLGLPEPGYYTKTDAESVKLRGAYKNHLKRILGLLNPLATPTELEANANAILNIETQLAQASLTRVELRNPEANYNLVDTAKAQTVTPHFNWNDFHKKMGLPTSLSFSLAPEKFFSKWDELLQNQPIKDWQSYLKWHLVNATAPALPLAFEEAQFDFFGKTLSGAKEMKPLWKRAIQWVNQDIGELLGKLFVEQNFPEKAKNEANDMVENLRAALKVRISEISWMNDETKEMAQKKLASFTTKIGYPNQWTSYKTLKTNRTSFIENFLAAQKFNHDLEIKKIGKTTNRNEWHMNPQEVNAYYNPLSNEIVFPAGILQPPFFDFEADMALNYGSMGAVIGHEFMHGFDDEGSQFDHKGNLKNWWTENDREEFDRRTAVLVDQYNQFKPLPNLNVNGKLTLGENIGDLSGLSLAFAGFKMAQKETTETDVKIDGFTQDQRFFLAWAQTWRNNIRIEALKLKINTDPHSPGRYRVNGVVANMPDFYKAFGCEAQNKLYLPDNKRAIIWE